MTDPEPGSERWTWLAEGNAKQARKRVSVDVLIRNEDEHILLVEPTYKDGWDLPGGMSEANEAPRQTATRELREELSVNVSLGRLLVIDWIGPHGPWDDLMAIVFDGGVLPSSSTIHLDNDELANHGFFRVGEALTRLPGKTANRLERAVKCVVDGSTSFLEFYG